MSNPIFVYSDDLLKYRFNDDHPFNQLRLKITYDLLKKSNALSNEHIVKPRIATDEELCLIHDVSYVHAVKQASIGALVELQASNFGL